MNNKLITNEILNVLSLEDSIPDFEIICYQLTNAGYNLKIVRVERREDFEDLLRSNSFDLILSDFSLPGFDAFGALRLCNEICPNVPFICVSGSIGEETAIELLKLGAEDYVLKDRPERLPFAIQRALDDAKEKETLRKVQTQLRKLSRAVEQSPNTIVITDTDGKIEYANPITSKLTGYALEELIGNNPRVLGSGETSQEEYKQLWDTIKAGKEWIGEFHNKKKNGELYWESATIAPVFDDLGIITNFLAIKKDITEDKNILLELIEAKEHAEESDRLKSSFLANISHEIRTPMNGILGFAELLKTPELSSDIQENYIRIIEQSGNRMLNIINDIVDISKIEAGQMKIHIQETNVNQLLSDLQVFFTPESKKKGLSLSLTTLLPDEESNIQTDHHKLTQILSNLIKNALKFTKSGSIEFGYSLTGSPTKLTEPNSELVKLQFFVKDTGVGIPANQTEMIFERFRQGSVSLTRAYEGAGLGLSISKAFIELLGGQIWVESESGKGSVFYFNLPFSKKTIASSKIVPINLGPKLRSSHILIAEDDEICMTYIKTILKNEDISIFEASNGIDAVDIVKINQKIDLVLMDMKMPEMDGYEATRQIKLMRPRLPVIAQTAYAFVEDLEKARKAGCDDYITKPIKKQELLLKIQNLIRS
jgi:PAS domain S-box-containing protein